MASNSPQVTAAYKWLKPNYQGVYGHGDYTDYLPKGARPGKWLPRIGLPKPCERGYHIVKIRDLRSHWGSVGSVLFEVETRGIVVPDKDKSACESIRLRKQVGVLTKDVLISFAIECAEHVLPIFEAESPDDDRPRKAIEAARSQAAHAANAAYAAYAAYAADAAYDAANAANAAVYAGYAAAAAAHAANAAYAAYHAASAAFAAYAANAAYHAASAASAAGYAAYAHADANGYADVYAADAAYHAANAAGYAADADADANADVYAAAEREWQGKRLLELISE